MAEPKASVMLNLPVEMKAQLTEGAMKEGVPLAAYCRKLLAGAIGFELPPEGRSAGRKYATPEEREAAQKAKAKERKELVKSLLDQYKAKQAKKAAEGAS